MGIWEDIASLPPEELDWLMQSESSLGQRIRWVTTHTFMAWRRGQTPPSIEELNAQFDALDA
jgi:hypothetical protein